jgi:hypothetical protein
MNRNEEARVMIQKLKEIDEAIAARFLMLEKLLKRYLDNHCQNADIENMSGLCECNLCVDTRKVLYGEVSQEANSH